MYRFLIDFICVIAVSGISFLLVRWFNVAEGLHVEAAVLGSIAYFFGKYATGSGFFSRLHYVNTGTPEIVWKVAGVICWFGAIISFFYHLP